MVDKVRRGEFPAGSRVLYAHLGGCRRSTPTAFSTATAEPGGYGALGWPLRRPALRRLGGATHAFMYMTATGFGLWWPGLPRPCPLTDPRATPHTLARLNAATADDAASMLAGLYPGRARDRGPGAGRTPLRHAGPAQAAALRRAVDGAGGEVLAALIDAGAKHAPQGRHVRRTRRAGQTGRRLSRAPWPRSRAGDARRTGRELDALARPSPASRVAWTIRSTSNGKRR